MQDLDLTNNNDGAINIECRKDKGLNIGIGDGQTYSQIILKDDEVTILTRWLVNYLSEVAERNRK